MSSWWSETVGSVDVDAVDVSEDSSTDGSVEVSEDSSMSCARTFWMPTTSSVPDKIIPTIAKRRIPLIFPMVVYPNVLMPYRLESLVPYKTDRKNYS